jgi:hypothetical protein
MSWAAAALTLLALSCNNLLRLRSAALAASAAFITYGLSAQLWPVFALHLVLVPINSKRPADPPVISCRVPARLAHFGVGWRWRRGAGRNSGERMLRRGIGVM